MKTKTLFIVAMAGVGLLAAGSARAAIFASSVADFSSVQGQGGWSYGYYSGTLAPAGFTLMTQYVPDAVNGDAWYEQAGTYWTSLTAVGGHPQGTTTSGGRTPVEQWAVRRWTSGEGGLATLSGHIADLNPASGTGITAHIFVDGAEVYTLALANGDLTGVDYSVPVVLSPGSTVDFAIDPQGSNDLADATVFTAVVVPEPGVAGFAGAAAIGLAARRRR